MLTRLREHTRDDAGFALIDVMVGIVIMALILGVISTCAVTVSTAVRAQVMQNDRQQYVNSYVNELAADPAAVPTTAASTLVAVAGAQLQVVRVRVSTSANLNVIRTAVPRGDAYDCTNAVSAAPTATDLIRCLTAETEIDQVSRNVTPYTPYTLTGVQAGVDGTTPVAVTTASQLASFTPDAATAKWVLGITPGADAGRIVFYQGATVITATSFEANSGPKYLYGTLASLTIGTPVTVKWESAGAGAGQAHHLLIYK